MKTTVKEKTDEEKKEKFFKFWGHELFVYEEYQFSKRDFSPVEGGRMRPHLPSEDEENMYGNL